MVDSEVEKQVYLGVNPKLVKSVTEDESVSEKDVKLRIFLTQFDKDYREHYTTKMSPLIDKMRGKKLVAENYSSFVEEALKNFDSVKVKKTEEKPASGVELSPGEKRRMIVWKNGEASENPYMYHVCLYTSEYKYLGESESFFENREDLANSDPLYKKHLTTCEVEDREH